MNIRNLIKIVNFYARFTPSYTKIGYNARRLTWGPGPRLDFSGQKWLVTGAAYLLMTVVCWQLRNRSLKYDLIC